jgi:hypothetical protein
MSLKSIPIQLHPDEIRQNEGHFEATWTPGDTIGNFQEWTRYWVRQDAEIGSENNASTLCVHVCPCVKDNQWKYNPIKKKFGAEVHGEMFAPLGKDKEEVEVLKTSPSNLKAIVVWAKEDGYVLDQESVEQLFPESIKIVRQGTAWIVYEKMLTSEERMTQQLQNQERRKQQERDAKFTITEDMVTGEEIRTLQFTNVDEDTGSKIFNQLTTAFSKSENAELNQNIANAVRLCDTRGPFKGFMDLFTADEQKQLKNANSALVQKVYKEFIRNMLAYDVENIMNQTDRSLTSHIEPMVGEVTNQDARESIERTLQTWSVNKENPHRNLYHRSNRSASDEDKNPGRAFVVPTYNQHPDYFAVCKMDNSIAGDNVGAGYDATMGILMLRLQNKEHDFLDALNAMHELTHKNQHANALSRSEDVSANHNRYIKSMIKSDTHIHGVLEEECEAWSNMIELLFAKIGFGDHNVAEVMRSLGISESDETKGSELYQIMQYAVIYYAGGGRNGNVYPPDFVEQIKKEYLGAGSVLHVLDEDGFPVLFKENK